MAIVDILHTGTLPPLGFVQASGQPAILALGDLAVDKESQAFFEIEIGDLRHVPVLHERMIHTGEFQGLQCV
jgi:hypothetical protein